MTKKERLPLPHEIIDSLLEKLNLQKPSTELDKIIHSINLQTPSEIADMLFGTEETMNEQSFEQIVRYLFEEIGYHVASDYIIEGKRVDLVLFPLDSNEKYAVECKYYKNNSVPAVVVKHIARYLDNFDKVIIVSSSGYARDANRVSKETGIILLSINDLISIRNYLIHKNTIPSMYLFSIPKDYENSLKNGVIHENILKSFNENAVSLSKEALIRKRDEKHWTIEDEKRVFLLEDTGPAIKVSSIIDEKQGIPSEKTELEKLYEDFLNAKTNKQKKESLETLAKYTLNLIEGFDVDDGFRSASEEIDLSVRNESNENYLRQLGTPILVECKNWKEPCDANHVRDFRGKLEDFGLCGGILISRNGITGDNYHDSKLVIRSAKKDRRHILVLSEEQIIEIVNGAHPADILRETYYDSFKM